MTQQHKAAQPAAPAIHGIRSTHKGEAQILRFLTGFLDIQHKTLLRESQALQSASS